MCFKETCYNKDKKISNMKSIYIYEEDLQKLYAMSTWKKFKGYSYADMIKWILEEPTIADIVISNSKVNKK
jgi:hypothetical protein